MKLYIASTLLATISIIAALIALAIRFWRTRRPAATPVQAASVSDAITEYRKRYGIREATAAELAAMSPDIRWHYDACAFKPFGMHYESFRHKGVRVCPIYLQHDGTITFGNSGNAGNAAQLCPMPKAA